MDNIQMVYTNAMFDFEIMSRATCEELILKFLSAFDDFPFR